MANPDLEDARRRWAAFARQRLASVVGKVVTLRVAFEDLLRGEPEQVADPSDGVVASCAELEAWLDTSKAPKGLGKAEGELGAVAGVYRNAAFAFRLLDDADSDARPARLAACGTMLEQGDHHVEVFLATLAKKVPVDPAETSKP